MKKIILITLLLTGCGQTCTPPEIELAKKLCDSHSLSLVAARDKFDGKVRNLWCEGQHKERFPIKLVYETYIDKCGGLVNPDSPCTYNYYSKPAIGAEFSHD